jgi:hypothetical protein
MEKIMLEVKDLKKSLPPMENSFSLVAFEGGITKKIYEGNFSCKIPNVKLQALIEKHKAVLNGGLEASLDGGTRHVHHMLAYLRYTLVQTPKWWSETDMGYELYDLNVIQEIYDKVLQFEKEWLENIWGPEDKASNDSVQKG